MQALRTAGLTGLLLLGALVVGASANVGLPALAFYLPPAWILLLPIVGVETLVALKLCRVQPGQALVGQALANGFSTLLGVPLAWAVLAALQVRAAAFIWNPREPDCAVQVISQVLWVLPPVRHCSWVVPVAVLGAWVAFFGLSVVCEYPILRRLFRDLPPAAVRRLVVLGNAASYALLAAGASAVWLWPTTFGWATRQLEGVVWFFASIGMLLARLMGLA